MPNAGTSVNNALLATNRLTPLFAFYSTAAGDYMYTTVAQAAASAIKGLLPPRVNESVTVPYDQVIGTLINEYPSFPFLYPSGTEPPPKAQVWIFTTDVDPFTGRPLSPLYRMTYKCDGIAPACVTNPNHVDRTYTTDTNGVWAYLTVGYELDGIEGYIFPNSRTQPVGTVPLYRRYNPTRDDHAVFPGSALQDMINQGYTEVVGGVDIIGYVYANTGPRPTY